MASEPPAVPEPARRRPHPIQSGIILTRQQQRAIRTARTVPLVYVTGEPGTGKTVVLRELHKQLVIAQPGKVMVVASTGTAAENMGIAGASTLHAAFGLGIGNRPAEEVVKWMKRDRRDTITRATHVILDEVSMVDDPLFTLWEKVCRLVRKSQKPFGGLCVTIFGDLRQLKPVPRKPGDAAQFCVFGQRWAECAFRHVMLTTPQRQAGDPFFLSILRDMAEGGPHNDGRLRPETLRALEDRSMLEPPTEGPGAPVFLFPTRNEVDAYNNDQLRALTTRGKRYEAIDWWPGKAKEDEEDDGNDESVRAEQKANEFFERCRLPASIFIKVGARVMLTWNVAVDEGLVNGTRGVVVGIQPDGSPLVHFDNWTAPIVVERQNEVLEGRRKDEILARRTQYPLCLCWAMTIHKAQGITSPICVDLTRAFTPEQMLVALSRARRLDDVYIRGRLPRIMPPDSRVLLFHEELAVQAHIEDAEDKEAGDDISGYKRATKTADHQGRGQQDASRKKVRQDADFVISREDAFAMARRLYTQGKIDSSVIVLAHLVLDETAGAFNGGVCGDGDDSTTLAIGSGDYGDCAFCVSVNTHTCYPIFPDQQDLDFVAELEGFDPIKIPRTPMELLDKKIDLPKGFQNGCWPGPTIVRYTKSRALALLQERLKEATERTLIVTKALPVAYLPEVVERYTGPISHKFV